MKTIVKKARNEDKVSTSGRYRYFKLNIYLPLFGIKSYLLKKTVSLNEVLRVTNFVSQYDLETTLQEFWINYEGKEVRIENFSGQLESHSETGAPFWHVVLETTGLITRKVLLQEISKALDLISDPKNPSIQINFTSKSMRLNKDNRLPPLDPNWNPGFFSKKFIQVLSYLKTEEFKEGYQALSTNDRDALKDFLDKRAI